MQDKKKYIWIGSFVIFVFLLIYQVLLVPYIGTANNGDFQRLMFPSGIEYKEDPWLEKDKFFFRYITNDFKVSVPVDNGWFSLFQFNVVLSKILCFLFSKTGEYDIRYLGLCNLILYSISIFIILRLFAKKKRVQCLLLSCTLLIVAVDPFIVQYMNSFYCEIGTIIALIFLYGTILLIFQNRNNCKKNFILLCAAAISAIFAICIKQQDILTFIPIIGMLLFALNNEILKKVKTNKLFINIVFIFLVTISVVIINNKNEGAGNQTACNVVLNDLLRCSDNPDYHLDAMGFSEDDKALIKSAIGTTTFQGAGAEVYEKFGDKFSRLEEVKIILREPQILFRTIQERSQYLFKDTSLGNFMEETGVEEYTKAQSFRVWSKIKSVLYQSNFFYYIVILILGGAIAFWNVLKKKRFAHVVILSMVVSNMLRFITVILGDSSHDDIKHFFALDVEFDVIFIYIVFQILLISFSLYKKKLVTIKRENLLKKGYRKETR